MQKPESASDTWLGDRLGPTRAAPALGDMVGDHRAHRWDVDHLAAGLAHHLGTCEVLPAAVTRHRGVVDDHVGLGPLGPPRCPGLPALAPYRSACICTAVGTRLARPDGISRRRPRGALRAAAQLRLEVGDPVAQRLVLCPQLLNQDQHLSELLRGRCSCHVDGLPEVSRRVVDLRAVRAQVT